MRRGGAKDAAKIETRVFQVFDEQSITFDKGGGSELRVIAWVVNGSEKPPQLERREWWMGEDGERRPGKAKGLSRTDFEFILKHRTEIGQHMGVPAKIIEESIESKPEGDAWDQ